MLIEASTAPLLLLLLQLEPVWSAEAELLLVDAAEAVAAVDDDDAVMEVTSEPTPKRTPDAKPQDLFIDPDP